MESTSFSDEKPTSKSTGTDNKGFVKENEYENDYAVNIELKDEINSDSVEEVKKESTSTYDEISVDEKNDEKINPVLNAITLPIEMLKTFCGKYSKEINIMIGFLLAVGTTAYLIAAMARNFDRAVTLLVLWSLVVGYAVYAYIRDSFGKDIRRVLRPFTKFVDDNMNWLQWIFILAVLAGIITWIVLDTSKRPSQLISGAGYLVFMFGLFITSKHPNKVYWRPVLWGGLIQLCFGMFILRTEAGFQAFNWAGMIAQTFINYVDAGVEFVYGPTWADHSFAFKTLSVVLYFSSFISIMYHLGAMQWLIMKIAWIMQITLRTSATESMVAAGNIFVGQTESPLLIRPFIADLTTSEIFAVMTAGFGTISGSVLGAYLGFGIKPSYVITACVMASPASLAVAKLQYPETKKSKFTNYKELNLETRSRSRRERREMAEKKEIGVRQTAVFGGKKTRSQF